MNIVVFSGAGMSAESGISTFRDANGLWANHKIEEVATPEAWLKNPEKVQQFYNQRRKQILESSPNEAHMLIKELEKIGNVTVITQNIDDLHGNIRESKSSGPNQEKKYYPIDGWELKMGETCKDGFQLRPHVVWFGESVPNLDVAAKIIAKANILIVIGTSLQVYPAAGLIHAAPLNCTKFLIDPNVGNMYIPSDFIALAETASEGMLQCLGLLKEKSGSN